MTDRTQEYTRAWPLALFLFFICLLCVSVYITVHRCGSEGSGSQGLTSLLRLSSRSLYPLSYLTNPNFYFTSRSYKLPRLTLNSLCSTDKPWVILCVWVFYVYASNECSLCACLVPWSLEERVRSLELEFEMTASHCVDSGNRTRVLSKGSQCS